MWCEVFYIRSAKNACMASILLCEHKRNNPLRKSCLQSTSQMLRHQMNWSQHLYGFQSQGSLKYIPAGWTCARGPLGGLWQWRSLPPQLGPPWTWQPWRTMPWFSHMLWASVAKTWRGLYKRWTIQVYHPTSFEPFGDLYVLSNCQRLPKLNIASPCLDSKVLEPSIILGSPTFHLKWAKEEENSSEKNMKERIKLLLIITYCL